MRSLLIFIVSISSYFFFILRPDNLIGGSDSYRGAWSAEFNSFFCARNPNPFINEKLWCYRPYINYDHEGYLYLGLGIIVGLSALLFNFKSFFSYRINYWFNRNGFWYFFWYNYSIQKIAKITYFLKPLFVYLYKYSLIKFTKTN